MPELVEYRINRIIGRPPKSRWKEEKKKISETPLCSKLHRSRTIRAVVSFVRIVYSSTVLGRRPFVAGCFESSFSHELHDFAVNCMCCHQQQARTKSTRVAWSCGWTTLCPRNVVHGLHFSSFPFRALQYCTRFSKTPNWHWAAMLPFISARLTQVASRWLTFG